MNRINGFLLIVSLILGALPGCGGDSGSTGNRVELALARSLWHEQGITSYRYEFNWGCFCPEEIIARVRVTVEDDSLTGVYNLDAEADVPPDEYSRYRTIDGLFDFVEEAMAEDADVINITYHEELGYPVTCSIDYSKQAYDEEMSFFVHELTVTP